MKKINWIYRGSIALNAILLIAILLIAYKYREKIYELLAPPTSYNIVMLGDALTAKGNWSEELNRADLKNSGTPGYTTSHFLWILNKAVIQYNPKICFIEAGLNDIEFGIPLKRVFSNYEAIVDTLISHQIEPVLQSNYFVDYPRNSTSNHPNVNETELINVRLDSLNTYLSELAKNKGIIYLDINPLLMENGKLGQNLSLNGVHLNDLGYKIWVQEIDKILKSKGL